MGYKISDFSSISGLSAANIRYYEQRGYPSAIRSENGYRQYELEDSFRINTFNEIISHGFTVSEAISLLKPHPCSQLADELEKKADEMEHEIELLRKKQKWNHLVRHVLQNAEEEFKQIHEVSLPKLCYLQCTEGLDHTPSIQNGLMVSKWVERLPLCHYAGRTVHTGEFSLGMIMEMEEAIKYDLVSGGTMEVSEGDYYVLLMKGEDEETEFITDSRVKTLTEAGYTVPDSIIRVYLMLETEEYGGFLNFVLLRR